MLVVDEAVPPTVAKRREVSIGSRRPGEVDILTGLEAGEFVVIHTTLRIHPGQEVKIIAVDIRDRKGDSI